MQRDTVVHAPLAEVFAFFADAANLQRLTPPWLRFSIQTQLPVIMRAGAEIDYRISLYGCPFTWRSRIDVWEPGVRFVDRQIIGPYVWWLHEHRFEPAGHSTRVIDEVEYLPRAALISAPLVRRDVEQIFSYRQSALHQIFPERSLEDPCSNTSSRYSY